MKTSYTGLTILAFTLWSLPLAHASINPAIVSADAKWVVHADLDVLRRSTLGQELIASAEKAQLSKTNGIIGVDFKKLFAMIGSATAYGANFSEEPNLKDGTLIVQGTADFRKIAESLLLQQTIVAPDRVVELTDLPFPAYGIRAVHGKTRKEGEEGGQNDSSPGKPAGQFEKDKIELLIAFPTEPIVLVSKSKEQLLKAREVFRGNGVSLAKADSSPLKRFLSASDDSSLFAATVAPSENLFPTDGPQSRILKMTSAGSLSLGERGTDTFARVELIARSDQMADKLMKILQGMTAMMSLTETGDKQLAEFLNSAAVERSGDAVVLNLIYPSERLAQMVQNLRQQTRHQNSANPPMIDGKILAEWHATASAPTEKNGPELFATRMIESVTLKNGTLLTLSCQTDGGKKVRFVRVEIIPSEGTGAPLVFRPEFIRNGSPRSNWSQLQFPGTDGTYTLKIDYVNDPEGKTAYAVSARDLAPTVSLQKTKKEE